MKHDRLPTAQGNVAPLFLRFLVIIPVGHYVWILKAVLLFNQQGFDMVTQN